MVKNVLFDATIIANTLDKNSSRSGIFFTALNILKQLKKNKNLNVYLYSCSERRVELEKAVLADNLTNCKIYNKVSFLQKYYHFLKMKKKLAKSKKRKIKKVIIQLKIMLISPLIKLINKFNTDCNYKNIDIFFSPCHKIPKDINSIARIKKYTIIHDVIPLKLPEYFPDIQTGNCWLLDVLKQMNNKDHYFANSLYTKNDFLKFVPDLKSENITVTPLACSETFKPEKEKTQKALEKYNLPTDKKYIFSLCTLEPRKNLIRAIRTFIEFIKKNKIDDLVFILGGGHWAEFIGTLEKEIDGLAQYKDKIIKAGYIDDEDLAPLYSGAEWFVYTSQYEGFGLPPLEAMACGCPVITSNNSSLPEVVGDAGQMIDWDSDEQHIAAYEKYYFDKKFKNEMAQKGYERSKQFSWQKCADTMIREMLKED